MRFVLWILMATAAAGFAICMKIFVNSVGIGKPPLNFCVVAGTCAIATPFMTWRVFKYEQNRHDRSKDSRPQLYSSDLIIVTFVMGTFFAVARSIAPQEFIHYAFWGGSALLGAILLSLLRASRRGHLSGIGRAAYTLGNVLTIIGIGGIAVFLFIIIIFCSLDHSRKLIDLITSVDFLEFRHAGGYGSISLIIGQSLAVGWHGSEKLSSPGVSRRR